LAINHATYIRNQSFTWALQGKTPIEAWTNKCPNIAHLQEFGIPVWILQEQQNISKLKPKSFEQIFVGFEDGPKAIKYYDKGTHHIKTSRNYYFSESPVQFEGEDKGEQIVTGIINNTAQNNKRKRPKDDDPNKTLQQSNRPRIQQDDRSLDDPFLTFDPALELASLACDPEEGHHIISSGKLINAAFNKANIASEDPRSLQEARESPEWPDWEKAIQNELDQLIQRNTWVSVDPPKEQVPIKNKWVFVKKYDKLGILTKYKARLVAKGYSQIPGMDYIDVFSPVVHLEPIRALLTLATDQDWEIQQMDVKGAYLNGTLKEEIYMAQPDGGSDGTNKAC